MAEDRFSKLESAGPLPEKLRSALSRLSRFDHLEITGSQPTRPAAAAAERMLCLHCNQSNEKHREHCWACYKPLATAVTGAKPDPGQEVELLLDGVSYRSSDPNLPVDIRRLIDRIREEGYSPELLKDWQASRKPPAPFQPGTLAPTTSKERRVQVIDGKYVDLIRIDDTLYKSDDPGLPPEVRELFAYIDQEGVTPALLQHLRLYGTKVKYRPPTTALPTDGDVAFWDAARKAFGI